MCEVWVYYLYEGFTVWRWDIVSADLYDNLSVKCFAIRADEQGLLHYFDMPRFSNKGLAV